MIISCYVSLFALIPPLISRRYQEFTYVPQVKLFTFCEARGLGCVSQAELALLPAAVVTDQGVIGLFDVHIIADTEHVTGSLRAQKQSQERTQPFINDSLHNYTGG